MPRLGCLLMIVLMTGCPKQYEVVTAPQQADMETFVVIQATRFGGMKVWDCREKPSGEAWDPTCVRTRMRNSARDKSER